MKSHYKYLFLITLSNILFCQAVIINEINYNSADDFNSGDWVEFYNPNSSTINISNWQFKDDNDEHIYIFPQNTLISPNGFLVLCRNSSSFTLNYPNISNYIGDMDFGLNGGGELIRLFDYSGELVDSVNYDDDEPWPSEPDGSGSTLELINYLYDNTLAENWASSSNFGTPGNINSTISESINEEIPSEFDLHNPFPNPFNSTLNLSFSLPSKSLVSVKVFNLKGEEIKTILNNTINKGVHKISCDAKNITSGIYFIKLRSNNLVKTKKVILLK